MDKKLDFSFISKVDIEIQSYCNRHCPWCPNREHNRDFKEVMPKSTFISILNQLKENGFANSNGTSPHTKGKISLIGYQEIFYDIGLLRERVGLINDIFNKTVSIHIISNGDLITREKLDGLRISSLTVNDYDNKGYDFWIEKAKDWGIYVGTYDKENEILLGYHRTIGQVVIQLNWLSNITLQDRAGYLDLKDTKLRTKHCVETSYYMTIDYQGNVMPCCHMRADLDKHKEYIMGNVNDTPLIDIYYSEKMNKLREIMQQDNGCYPEVCKYCTKDRHRVLKGFPNGFVHRPYIDFTVANEVSND